MDAEGNGMEFKYDNIQNVPELREFSDDMIMDGSLFTGSDYFSCPGVGLLTAIQCFAKYETVTLVGTGVAWRGADSELSLTCFSYTGFPCRCCRP